MNVGLDYKTSQIIHDGFGLCTVYCCFLKRFGDRRFGALEFQRHQL